MTTLEIELDAGCGRKVHSADIEICRDSLVVATGNPQFKIWHDAVPVSGAESLKTSIDTSIRALHYTKDFFQSSIVHAMRDLQASFCRPADYNVSLRLNSNSVTEELAEFAIAVAEIFEVTGASVGKIHSYMGEGPTEVTVSVIGDSETETTRSPKRGAILCLTGGIVTVPGASDFDWRQRYSEGVDLAQIPGAMAAKDVSGDGLAGALHQFSEDFGLSITVSMSKVPISSANVDLDDCNLDRNLADFGEHLDAEISLDATLRSSLMKPQFCGPILILVDPDFLEQLPTCLVPIGACTNGLANVIVRK